MKVFKKISTVAVAAVMGCSLCALTACNPDGGDNGGDNSALLAAVLEQEIKAVNFNLSYSSEIETSNYAYDNYVKGNKLGNETKSVNTQVSVKLDLSNLNADVAQKTDEGNLYAFIRGGSIFMLSSGKAVTDFSNAELAYGGSLKDMLGGDYGFEDDYEYGDDTGYGEVDGDDYESGDDYVEEVQSPMSVLMNMLALLDFDELGEVVSGVIGAENYSVMAFANSFNALTVENGTATADLNKACYNFYNDLVDFLDKLSLDMTVNEVLTSDVVKGILSPFANVVTPEQFVENINASVPEDGAESMSDMILSVVSGGLVTPDKGETTYDYILRVLGSDELLSEINEVLDEVSGGSIQLETTLDKVTLKTAMELYSEGKEVTENEFNGMVKSYKDVIAAVMGDTTATCLTVDMSDAGGSDIATYSNVKVVYTLDGNKVTEQTFSMNFTSNGEYVDRSGSSYILVESSENTELGGTITYPDSAALTDVNNCKVGNLTVKDYLD